MNIRMMLLTAITMYFLIACNSEPETSTANSDTTTSNKDTATTQGQLVQDTATTGFGLMKAMEDMTAKMQSVHLTGDFDVDFAKAMVEHHQGAIAMSQVEIAQGRDETMKAMAQEILAKQTEEQELLRDFIKNYKPSGMKHGEGELQRAMSDMNSKMKSMQISGNTDKDFATMMTSHHEDGIAMQKLEVKNGMDGKLKQMAQKGITAHQKEIAEFKSWLTSQN